MEYVREYFITYFPLLIISVGMFFIAIFDFKLRKRACSYIISIIIAALLLSILLQIERYGVAISNKLLATIFAILGYSIRPFVALLFILLGDGKFKKNRLWFLIPLGINFLIYCFALFFDTPLEKLVFYYADIGNGFRHYRGSILCLTSHAVSAILLGFLVFVTLKKLKSRHSVDSFAILSCIFFVVVAVIVESLTDNSGLLNNAIGVSCVFYYLFMFNEMNRRDVLTGLFDRKTYYLDESRFGNEVTGVIHADMNGLKTINDKFGHEEGDKAIAYVGKVIIDKSTKQMYSYRIGGDEFVVLCLNTKEKEILEVINNMKEELNKTIYSASFGHGMREDKDDSVEDMLKIAEMEMYKDKNYYYLSNNIDRRKR